MDAPQNTKPAPAELAALLGWLARSASRIGDCGGPALDVLIKQGAVELVAGNEGQGFKDDFAWVRLSAAGRIAAKAMLPTPRWGL